MKNQDAPAEANIHLSISSPSKTANHSVNPSHQSLKKDSDKSFSISPPLPGRNISDPSQFTPYSADSFAIKAEVLRGMTHSSAKGDQSHKNDAEAAAISAS